MKTLDFIDELKYGALNNTHFSNVQVGQRDSVAPLLYLIDEGLSRLHTRFVLSEKTILIEQQDGITNYHLRKIYSIQGNDPIRVPRPYILDLPNEPFQEDVLKVLSVVGPDQVERLLGDYTGYAGVTCPQHDTLQFRSSKEGNIYLIQYQARHLPMLIPGTPGFTVRETMDLPPVLVPALSNYVTYLVHSRINTPESQAKAVLSLQVFEAICSEVSASDAVSNSVSSTNIKFSRNGWQ